MNWTSLAETADIVLIEIEIELEFVIIGTTKHIIIILVITNCFQNKLRNSPRYKSPFFPEQ